MLLSGQGAILCRSSNERSPKKGASCLDLRLLKDFLENMHRTTPASILAFLVISTINLQAQTNDLPALDTARLMQELQTLVDNQESQQKSLVQKQVNTLKPATASGQAAAKLYEDAAQEVGTKSDQQGQAKPQSDRRRALAEELRSESFQAAAQLHARYLQMALEYDPQNKAASANASWEYAQALARTLSDPKLSPSSNLAKELLQKPAKESVISRWLNIAHKWPSDKNWSPQAGNLDDILDKNVRSVWREEQDPRLLSTWDLQIQMAEDDAKSQPSTADKFAISKPKLLFSRARDMATLGQPNRAATEIFLIAQSNPNHPDFSQWVSEVKKILSPATSSEIETQ